MQSSPSYSLSILSCFYTEMDENRKLPIIPNSKHLVYEDEMGKIKESSLDFTVLSSQNLYIYILSFPLDESSRPIYLFLKKKKEKEIQPIKSSLVMGKLTHIHVFMFVLIFSGFKSKTALLVSRLIKIIITTMCFTYKMYMH